MLYRKGTSRHELEQSARRTGIVLLVAIKALITDGALSRGAAIAYYSVFAIAPILLIGIASTGLFFGEAAAQDAIVKQFSELMGSEAAELLRRMIVSTSNLRGGMLGTALGVGTLLLTTTGVFGEIQSALNAIWRVRPQPTSVSIFLRRPSDQQGARSQGRPHRRRAFRGTAGMEALRGREESRAFPSGTGLKNGQGQASDRRRAAATPPLCG